MQISVERCFRAGAQASGTQRRMPHECRTHTPERGPIGIWFGFFQGSMMTLVLGVWVKVKLESGSNVSRQRTIMFWP